MATIETDKLTERVLHYFERTRSNLRSNAMLYKAQLAAGRSVKQVADVATADALLYIRNLGQIKAIDDTPARRTKLTDGLTARGITLTEVRSEYTTLRAAAVAQRDAPKTTAAEINAMADATLAAVVEYDMPDQMP